MVGAVLSKTTNYGFNRIRFDMPGWHGLEHDNWTLADALLSSIGSVPGSRGIWANGTAYAAGDRVADPDGGGLYRCAVAHTSATSGTFSADRAAHPSYWALITQVPVWVGTWTTATSYSTQDIVRYTNAYYYCVAAHTSGTFATDLAAGKWTLVFNLQDAYDQAAAAAASATAAAGSATAAAGSATAAANSATAASGSASAAATSATNAATSATNSSTYATSSSGSAVAADNSRIAAASSATAAATSATNASTSATNASNSATAASNSATAAAASATAAANSITHGQCRLVMTSNTVLTLQPYNGVGLKINGVVRSIDPASPPTIGPWGASLHRYIYAYWTGTAIALEASTTTHTTDTVTGVRIKSGDATRTLVGMAMTVAANTFADDTIVRYVASYFNRRRKHMAAANIANTTSGAIINLSGTFLNFITWFDEVAEQYLAVTIDVPDLGIGYIGVGVDGSAAYINQSYAQNTTGNWFDTVPAMYSGQSFTENVPHYFHVMGGTSNGALMSYTGNPLHMGFVVS